MIKEWIEEYRAADEVEILSALREIMQEVTLAGLSRSDFFRKAAFYGGTALRIFHGLDRYSEDMDFSLLTKDPHFSLEPYFPAIQNEFNGLGLQVSLRQKVKRRPSSIESAFLKTETLWRELILEDMVRQTGIRSNKNVKIKIGVDRIPPLNFNTEERLLLRPFSFYVKCFDLPSLFAGKMHALLFRKWKNRVKGRDWYDMEWYIRKGVPLNLLHFLQRAKDTEDWPNDTITKEEFMVLLQDKIQSTPLDRVIEDVRPFVRDLASLEIWSRRYFLDLVKRIKIEG